MNAPGDFHPWSPIADDGSRSPESFRARRMTTTAARRNPVSVQRDSPYFEWFG